MRNSNDESTVGNKKMISYEEGLALSRQIKAKQHLFCPHYQLFSTHNVI
jgi:hypothetical protein